MDNRREFIAELADVFGQQAEAEALLEEIRFPRDLRPPWQALRGASRYWADVVAEIENGRLLDGDLELLARAARDQHPANRVFVQAAEYGRRLRTYADQPVANPGQDAFGFLEYADVFSILINDEETATPLTVAVSGPWGSGKTSLAKLIEARLNVRFYWRRGWSKAPITCWFNAWMHSDAQYLGAALAASVTRQICRRRPFFWKLVSPLPSVMLSPEQRAWRRVWTWLVVVSIALGAFFGLLWIFPGLRSESGSLGHLYGRWNVLAVWVAVPALIALCRSAGKVRDSLGAFIDSPRSAAAQGTLDEVHGQLGRVIRQAQGRRLGRAERRVVIFIDDLERCPTDKAIDICEVVSQLLSHADVITVLVANLDLLELAANARSQPSGDGQPVVPGFSEIGEQYLHKLIQLRFNLPPPDQGAVASALALAGQLDPSDPASRGIRNRLAAAQKWVGDHQVVLGVYSFAVFVAVLIFFHFASSNIRGAVRGSGSQSGGGSGFIDRLDHVITGGFDAIEEVTSIVYAASARHPFLLVPIFLGMASASFAYMVARRSISRIWAQRRPRGPGAYMELRRLEEYDSSREEAEHEITAYLPANLRRAKRLINHQRLYAQIGKYRGIFGGDPELTHRHLAKWVLIVEHWPWLGTALTRDPAMMAALEQASDVPQLQKALGATAPGAEASGELLRVLQYGTSLSPVLARLVRFEASAAPRGWIGPEGDGKQSDDDGPTGHRPSRSPANT